MGVEALNAKPTAAAVNLGIEAQAAVPPTASPDHAGPLFAVHRGAIAALHRSRRHDEAVSSVASARGMPCASPHRRRQCRALLTGARPVPFPHRSSAWTS
jgi:hypothetical protein